MDHTKSCDQLLLRNSERSGAGFRVSGLYTFQGLYGKELVYMGDPNALLNRIRM